MVNRCANEMKPSFIVILKCLSLLTVPTNRTKWSISIEIPFPDSTQHISSSRSPFFDVPLESSSLRFNSRDPLWFQDFFNKTISHSPYGIKNTL